MVAFSAICAIMISPELALVLSFSSGIFKEWLSTTVPIFAQFDFTIAIFLLTFASTLFFLARKGLVFEQFWHSSLTPLFLFTAFMLLSILYTPSFQYGSIKTFSFVVFNWALFLFPVLTVRDERTAWRIIYWLVLLGCGVSLFTVLTLLRGIVEKSFLFSYRASFLGISPISFANWVGAITVLLISILPQIHSKVWKRMALFAIVLMTLSVLVANSRGPLLSFLLTGIVIIIVRSLKSGKKQLFLWTIGVALLLVLFFSLLPAQLTSRYTDILENDPGSKYFAYYTVNTRLYAWRAAFDMTFDHLKNLLVGVGTGGFSNVFYRQDTRFYPHNIFLEVICELGIVGLFLLSWHFLAVFRPAVRMLRSPLSDAQRTLLFAFLMAAAFNIIGAQFSGDLNDNRRLWFFLGTLVAMEKLIGFSQAGSNKT